MILPYQDLIIWAEGGGVDPFDVKMVNPASIDLRWSGKFKRAGHGGWSKEMLAETLTLHHGDFFLLDTLEYIKMTTSYAGILALKSSLGRSGFEHLHAGFFDPGFEGTATLEVESRAPWSFTIERGQPIVQLALLCMLDKPDFSYAQTGRYQGQCGPTEARQQTVIVDPYSYRGG